MPTEVVVTNDVYRRNFGITTVRSVDGIIARFYYDASNPDSVASRLADFARFSIARNIVVVDVIGVLVP